MFTILLVHCLAYGVSAQTWSEWFRQRKTQIKYLHEQISALQAYESAVKDGYDLADKGIKAIAHFKKSDLQLHEDHFSSLLVVKESVKDSKTARRIVVLCAAIQQIHRECQKKIANRDEFLPSENAYFSTVLDDALWESKALAEQALLLLSDGQYQMSDDERLKRLQTLSEKIEDLYAFVRHFSNTVSFAALNRLNEQKETKKLKRLF